MEFKFTPKVLVAVLVVLLVVGVVVYFNTHGKEGYNSARSERTDPQSDVTIEKRIDKLNEQQSRNLKQSG